MKSNISKTFTISDTYTIKAGTHFQYLNYPSYPIALGKICTCILELIDRADDNSNYFRYKVVKFCKKCWRGYIDEPKLGNEQREVIIISEA